MYLKVHGSGRDLSKYAAPVVLCPRSAVFLILFGYFLE